MGKVTKEQKAIYNLRYRLKNLDKAKAYRKAHADEIKAIKAENYKNNKEKFKVKNAEYRKNNPEKVKANNSSYRKNNPEKSKIYSTNYRKQNKENIKNYAKNYHKRRRDEDFLYKLRMNISSLIRMSFKNIGSKKSAKTEKILGCSLEEFGNHIKSKMETWMNESNYGQYNPLGPRTWNIDHIIPVSSANTKEKILRLNHHTNLRPLCSRENLKKRNQILLSSL